ncbi:hypothetical protein PAMP_019101 [Pampus punctatissimus]
MSPLHTAGLTAAQYGNNELLPQDTVPSETSRTSKSLNPMKGNTDAAEKDVSCHTREVKHKQQSHYAQTPTVGAASYISSVQYVEDKETEAVKVAGAPCQSACEPPTV